MIRKAARLRGRLALLACLAMIGPAVAACGSGHSGSGSGSGVELQFWTINLKGGYQSYIEDSIHAYQKSHPGTHIQWTDIPDFEQTQTKLLAAIAGGAAPDVVNMTPFILPQFVSANAVYSIGDLTSNLSAVQQKYVPSLWDAGVVGGKAYAIPYYGSVSALIYNAKLFRQAGLDPAKPPTTWPQVFQDARVIYKKTRVSGFAQTLDNFDDAGNPADILAGEAGVPLLNGSGKQAAFNTPQAANFLSNYVQGMKQGWIDKISATGAVMDSAQALAQGSTAMVFMGPWILHWLKSNTNQSTYQNFRIADHPVGDGGAANAFLQDFAIPRASAHPKQALSFAQYMASTSLELAKQAPVLPALVSQTKNPYFQSSEATKVLVDQNMKFYWPKIAPVADLFDALKNQFEAAYLGKSTPQQALSAAAKQWDQILATKS